eukprot:2079043-Amphidinium_carterae.1
MRSRPQVFQKLANHFSAMSWGCSWRNRRVAKLQVMSDAMAPKAQVPMDSCPVSYTHLTLPTILLV